MVPELFPAFNQDNTVLGNGQVYAGFIPVGETDIAVEEKYFFAFVTFPDPP